MILLHYNSSEIGGIMDRVGCFGEVIECCFVIGDMFLSVEIICVV